MGLKFIKFHGILHMMEDILLYGVPMELDTGANESHHKQAKQAAKVTQRKRSTFDIQVAKRLYEYLLLDLAWVEITSGMVNWAYHNGFQRPRIDYGSYDTDESFIHSFDRMDISGDFTYQGSASSIHSDPSGQSDDHLPHYSDPPITNDDQSASQGLFVLDRTGESEEATASSNGVPSETGGAMIRVWRDDDAHTNHFKLLSRSNHGETTFNMQLLAFLVDLQAIVIDQIPEDFLPIYTFHKQKYEKGHHIWHGHPNYRGQGAWKDWAFIDWGAEGVLPSHIHCFVCLEHYQGRRQEFGGIRLEAGTYAVVETSKYEEMDEEKRNSELFVPILLDVLAIRSNKEVDRQFWLANVEAIHDVACVVPDIGGPLNRYFFVQPRPRWSKMFVEWVKAPHNKDDMSDEEFTESEDDDKNEDENEDSQQPISEKK